MVIREVRIISVIVDIRFERIKIIILVRIIGIFVRRAVFSFSLIVRVLRLKVVLFSSKLKIIRYATVS